MDFMEVNPHAQDQSNKVSQTMLRAYPQKAPNLQLCDYFSPSK